MKNILFLKDCFINREIAFVFNIPYKIADKIDNNNYYFVLDDEDKKVLNNQGINYVKEYVDLDSLCNYLSRFERRNLYKRKSERDIDKINSIPLEDLFLSEMLIKVLYSKPKNIDCKEIDIQANIDNNGDVWGCCPGWVAQEFGNIIKDKDWYNNYYARIIKLSYINKTFCFCNLKKCKYNNYKEIELDENSVKFETDNRPKHIIISTDKTCNLKCNSCRKEFFVPTQKQKELTHKVTQKLLETGWLDEIPFMIAGQGEAFYSEEYLNLLKTDKRRNHIEILTNGNLFTEEKWKLIDGKYEKVSVSVSIDAAKKETYIKLRHGNFDALLNNLAMIAKYRNQLKIQYLSFNFVVQKENMNEMVDFIKLANMYNADVIQFTKLNNWGTMKEDEYKEKSLIIDGYLNIELYKILSNPIFNDEKIDISSLKGYYEKSKEIYEKNNILI